MGRWDDDLKVRGSKGKKDPLELPLLVILLDSDKKQTHKPTCRVCGSNDFFWGILELI